MSDTPRTDNESLSGQGKSGRSYVSVNFTRQLERELNAANERIKQIEADAHKSTQKIQRLEGWNTQNCADKVNLMETLRYREERIKRLVEIGNEMVNLMSGDESVSYDDWITQSWDAKSKWEEASRNAK